jgi:hypothetical protein
MGAIPGTLEPDQQPPMTLPLGHFIIALGFLLCGIFVGLGMLVNGIPGRSTLAHVHLLLAGWICITIMGAMTQFVPVWSGVTIHSRRLASAQLSLLVVGLSGFVGSLVVVAYDWIVIFGACMLLGFWIFAYNIGRTLWRVEDYDVTEQHFLIALTFFIALTLLGLLLAIDFSHDLFAGVPVDRLGIVAAHATVAVFGAILTTVYGALYQLGTMFTQTELHGVDTILQRIESASHPTGVVLLAGGRLLQQNSIALAGALLILAAAFAFSAILAHKLYEMQVPWTPMHTRYAIVVPALLGWAALTLPSWLWAPTAPIHRFGGEGTVHLLVLGTIGFVVFGTLYHIIPFIIWVHRYSDQLGYEDVPMIDDLYDDRLAAIDGTLLGIGTVILVASDLLALPAVVSGIGAGLVALGVVVFTGNMLLVVREHSPFSIGRIVRVSLDPR